MLCLSDTALPSWRKQQCCLRDPVCPFIPHDLRRIINCSRSTTEAESKQLSYCWALWVVTNRVVQQGALQATAALVSTLACAVGTCQQYVIADITEHMLQQKDCNSCLNYFEKIKHCLLLDQQQGYYKAPIFDDILCLHGPGAGKGYMAVT